MSVILQTRLWNHRLPFIFPTTFTTFVRRSLSPKARICLFLAPLLLCEFRYGSHWPSTFIDLVVIPPHPTLSHLHFRTCKLETQQSFPWAPLILVLPIFLSQKLSSTLPSWTEKKENDLIYQITNSYLEFKLLGKFNVLPLQGYSFPCGKIWNYGFKWSKLDLSRNARVKEELLKAYLKTDMSC